MQRVWIKGKLQSLNGRAATIRGKTSKVVLHNGGKASFYLSLRRRREHEQKWHEIEAQSYLDLKGPIARWSLDSLMDYYAACEPVAAVFSVLSRQQHPNGRYWYYTGVMHTQGFSYNSFNRVTVLYAPASQVGIVTSAEIFHSPRAHRRALHRVLFGTA